MKNIVWQRPDGSICVTHVIIGFSSDLYDTLRNRGDIPADWIIKGYDKEMPIDRLFRPAWAWDGFGIISNMSIAREIAHAKRRQKRDVDFAPYDRVISKQIPGDDQDAAESARQSIRVIDAAIQAEIDAVTTEQDLRLLMAEKGLV